MKPKTVRISKMKIPKRKMSTKQKTILRKGLVPGKYLPTKRNIAKKRTFGAKLKSILRSAKKMRNGKINRKC